MDITDVLTDGIGRSEEGLTQTLDGLSVEQLNTRPGGTHNSITWLAWHTARQQDAQIADLAGGQQVWRRDGWADRFGLDLPADSMGYGHDSADVAKVRVDDPSLLTGYLQDATAATRDYVASLSAADLDEVIDDSWDPPVTRGSRLVSIVDDAAQHAGQAAYVRGLLT